MLPAGGQIELHSPATEFDLPPFVVEVANEAPQCPELERRGDTLFVVLRAARYLAAPEEFDFGELQVVLGPGFVLTVRHADAHGLSAVHRPAHGSYLSVSWRVLCVT